MRIVRTAGLLPAIALLCVVPVRAQVGAEASSPTFRLGLSAATIADVGPDEALAVTSALTRRLAPMSVGVKEPETVMFREFDDLRRRLGAGDLDVIIVTGLEYARLDGSARLDPAFVPRTRAGDSFRVVLLSRRSPGIGTLADLRGRSLLISKDQSAEAQTAWIETEVMKLGHPRARSFFSSVGTARNPSQAILSVFFGSVDACLATDAAFAVASELNPQIGATLVHLARSPQLPAVVVAFRIGYAKMTRDRVAEAILRLHEDPEGQQLLRIFRTEKLVAIRPELLESSRALLNDYEEQQAAHRQPASLSKSKSKPRPR